MSANESKRKTQPDDISLISSSLNGDKIALEKLVMRYKDWIFNLAIRMVNGPQDAEDVTQEILIKLITHLDKFDEKKASFKTWIYRVAVNHMINMKKRGIENCSINFDNYYERMDHIDDRRPVDSPEIKALIQDTLTNCIMATLVCLKRLPRLAVILSVIFGINPKTGSAILGISYDNYRKILSRSKSKLKKFMGTTCSLVNKNAKCKCELKITGLIEQGYRDPKNLIYDDLKYDRLIRDIAGGKTVRFIDKYFNKFEGLFRSQPFWEAPGMTDWLNGLLNSRDFREIFNLD